MAGEMILTSRPGWWPLAPVGFLVCHSWYIQVAWASLLLGCVIKMLVVRLGGSSLLVRLRPMFVGLIIGEALTIGLWLVVSLALAGADLPFYRVMLSPR